MKIENVMCEILLLAKLPEDYIYLKKDEHDDHIKRVA